MPDLSPTARMPMELRSVELEARNVIGVCVPYNQTTYLVPSPRGERMLRGAFAQSLQQRGQKIFLCLDHNEVDKRVGRATDWDDGDPGLVGTFHIASSDLGDRTLQELHEGWWPYMSVAFRPMKIRKGNDGVDEITIAHLGHVSLVSSPAYTGAEVLAVRDDHSSVVERVMAGFGPRPDVDLSPLPPLWG